MQVNVGFLKWKQTTIVRKEGHDKTPKNEMKIKMSQVKDDKEMKNIIQ